MAPTSSESGRDGSELTRRSKRTVSRKAGATSALDKIRKFRETGERSKYEVGMVQDVYQVVNEDEYSDIVRKRQEEDWVIDDDGTGYVDDGREIFDDDLEEPADGKNAPKFKPKRPNVKKPTLKPKTIKKMLLAASAKAKKPKKEVLSLGEDDILSGLLKEAELPRPAAVKMSKGKGHILRTPTSYSSSIHTPRRLQDLSVVRQPIIKEEPKSPTTPTNHAKIGRVAKRKVAVKTELCDQMAAQYGGVPGEKMKIEDRDNILENMDTRFDDIPDDDMPEYNPEGDDFGGGDDDDDDLGGADAIQALSKAEKILDEKAKIEVEDAKKPSYRNCAFPQKMTELPDNSGWETVLGIEDSQKQEVLPDVNVDSSSLPLQDINGTVYLFGKVWIESAKAFVSCSVAVKNIERQIFILPREKKREVDGSETDKPVEFIDVYQEFNDKIATKHRIMKFISRKVQKAYAFEIQDVPVMSDYLEVRYSAEYAQLPSDLSGETFSHVFGTNTSRTSSATSQLAVATKPDHLEVAMQQDAPPPMVVMSLSFRTMLNTKNHTHEILAVSALIHHEVSLDKAAPKQNFQYHFCGVSKPNDQMYPYDFKDQTKIEITTSERALLGLFMAKIHRIDPDVLVGHDIYGFDLDLLLHRINACKIPHWSRLGRLKRTIMPKLSNGYANKGGSLLDRSITCGRMVCDVKISSKELIRCKSYDLTALSWSVLQSRREEIDQDEIPNKFKWMHYSH
ncbi:DNA polymerase alpha catalytic subunit [Acropora cervicornis]|uniref:DNA polymerase alpha catalytic subunit n=1 Tax=Acropora cervicornis TaxID=6130 RepID=A0AAD9R5Y6_ACRCE|nr:DNA polymerase alpha catalytic subunit [Acropora cervicornis]